jgi:hypothetical protein
MPDRNDYWSDARPRRLTIEAGQTRDGFYTMPGGVHWTYFITLTFKRPQKDSMRAASIFHSWQRRWQLLGAVRLGWARRREAPTERSGRRWHDEFDGPFASAVRRRRDRSIYALAVEKHRSGSHHMHALLVPSPRLEYLPVGIGIDLWQQQFGNGGLCSAKIEVPHSQEAVRRYLIKDYPHHSELHLSNYFPTVPSISP